MPLRHVSEACVHGQSFHSAHCSVQSVHSIILYPGYSGTFGFPSPLIRWFCCLPEGFVSSLRIFPPKFLIFFSHIVNCISLHMTRQRLRLHTCLEIQMQIRSISFLYINVCKDAHGNSCAPSIHHPSISWQRREAHVPCAQQWNTPVLSPHLLGWDWNPSTSHHLWTKVSCLCSSLLLVPPAVHRVICRGRGK